MLACSSEPPRDRTQRSQRAAQGPDPAARCPLDLPVHAPPAQHTLRCRGGGLRGWGDPFSLPGGVGPDSGAPRLGV